MTESDGAPPVPPPPISFRESVVEPLREFVESLRNVSEVEPLDVQAKLAELHARAQLHTSPAPSTGVGPTGVNGLIDWFDIFHSVNPEGDDWLLEPLVPRQRLTAVVAEAKAGKSLLLLEAGLAVATGRPFLSHPRCEPRRVLYLDYEMTAADLRARASDMGYGGDDYDIVREMVAYYQLPGLAPLDTPEGAAQLLGLVDTHGPELVIVDTLGRAVEGEENSNDTGRNFYRLAALPVRARGITLVRADHLGKDRSRGPRGGSAKSDDVDLEWHLTRKRDVVTLKRALTRIPWPPQQLALQLHDESPLHRQIAGGWHPRTPECVRLLDELGVPINVPYRRARELVREAGQTAPRNEVLRDALRFRKER